MDTNFSDLTEDLALRIFKLLDFENLLNCTLVCKCWSNLITNTKPPTLGRICFNIPNQLSVGDNEKIHEILRSYYLVKLSNDLGNVSSFYNVARFTKSLELTNLTFESQNDFADLLRRFEGLEKLTIDNVRVSQNDGNGTAMESIDVETLKVSHSCMSTFQSFIFMDLQCQNISINSGKENTNTTHNDAIINFLSHQNDIKKFELITQGTFQMRYLFENLTADNKIDHMNIEHFYLFAQSCSDNPGYSSEELVETDENILGLLRFLMIQKESLTNIKLYLDFLPETVISVMGEHLHKLKNLQFISYYKKHVEANTFREKNGPYLTVSKPNTSLETLNISVKDDRQRSDLFKELFQVYPNIRKLTVRYKLVNSILEDQRLNDHNAIILDSIFKNLKWLEQLDIPELPYCDKKFAELHFNEISGLLAIDDEICGYCDNRQNDYRIPPLPKLKVFNIETLSRFHKFYYLSCNPSIESLLIRNVDDYMNLNKFTRRIREITQNLVNLKKIFICLLDRPITNEILQILRNNCPKLELFETFKLNEKDYSPPDISEFQGIRVVKYPSLPHFISKGLQVKDEDNCGWYDTDFAWT